MKRHIGFVIASVVLPAGVASADRSWDPLTFFDASIITRHYAAPADTQTAFRTVGPLPEAQQGESTALTGDFRFGMLDAHKLFAAGEVEFGRLTNHGSNVAGGYAVVGLRAPVGPTLLTAELAAGVRSIRYDLDAPDVTKFIVEPRVRAEIWLDSQFTLGVALGTTIDDRSVWMAGIQLGVHSHEYGIHPR